MTLVEYLKCFIKVPYVYSGNSPLYGMDCSGFICEGLRAFGILKGDYSAQGLHDLLKGRFPVPDQIASECLLFFGEGLKSIQHISMSINRKLMIEAGGGDKTTKTIDEAIKRNAFVRIRPIITRKDYLTALKISY